MLPMIGEDSCKRHGIFRALRRLGSDNAGSFALMSALVMMIVVVAMGGTFDLLRASAERQKMQQSLDAAVLAAVRKTSAADQRSEVQRVFLANFNDSPVDFDHDLKLTQNTDKSITAELHTKAEMLFMGIVGKPTIQVGVKASAIASNPATTTSAGPCVYVLASSGQDMLINSGANWRSAKCSIDVASTASPAFIMNGGATVDFSSFCVKGTNYIKNGGNLANLATGCNVHADPYAGILPEPVVSSVCTTSGTISASTVTMEPGVHCGTTFNGSPTITFKPGLHIIKDRMIINSGSTVIATGVTFYFPDTNSEIRANGNLTLKASAPTSGTYQGILIFEKTSNAANNANKMQYIFNGSVGETLAGIIYLPNRNVTYNSTSNVTANIAMVVNQMIINNSNWTVEPYTGATPVSAGANSSAIGARLTQ